MRLQRSRAPITTTVAALTLISTATAFAADVVGTWRLVRYEDRSAGVSPRFPYGEHPEGLLMYDNTGHMSIQIMRTPHPKVTSGDEDKVTNDEKIALFDAYVAYFGTYHLDALRNLVTHHVEGDLADVYIGRDEDRPYDLEGDRLTLRPVWISDGKKWEGVRVFERVK